MSIDKLLRERFRVERELLGTAHPFIVTGYLIRRGGEVVAKAAAHENPLLPYTTAFPPRLVAP